MRLTGRDYTATDTVSLLFPHFPTPTKFRNTKARERVVEIISKAINSRPDDQVSCCICFSKTSLPLEMKLGIDRTLWTMSEWCGKKRSTISRSLSWPYMLCQFCLPPIQTQVSELFSCAKSKGCLLIAMSLLLSQPAPLRGLLQTSP